MHGIKKAYTLRLQKILEEYEILEEVRKSMPDNEKWLELTQ